MGKSTRLAKKRQDHTSQRHSTQHVDAHAHCHDAQGLTSTSTLLSNIPITCSPRELNPRDSIQLSISSVEESAAAWVRMTETQVRSQILSQKYPEQVVMAVLQAMSADSRQHTTMVASLTAWFQNQLVQTHAYEGSASNPRLCASDAAYQPAQLDQTVPVCRNHSSDVSAMTSCLTTSDEQCALASDVAHLVDKHGMNAVHGEAPVTEALLPGAGTDVAAVALTLEADSIQAAQERDAACAAALYRPDWVGVTEHASCDIFLEEDDNLFEGMAPLDGTLEGLEDGIDVRNLWAGGDSLEAWSDCTMSDELTFVDSESVTGAILECFKDPIWRQHEPPDELPSTFATLAPAPSELAVQAVSSPAAAEIEVGAVRHCYQDNVAAFSLEAADPLDDHQPACWNDPDYTPGGHVPGVALQAWEKPGRTQRKGSLKPVQGEEAAARQACDSVGGDLSSLNVYNNFVVAQAGNAICGEPISSAGDKAEAAGGTDTVVSQSSKALQVKKGKVGKKCGNKAVGVKKGKGKHTKSKGKSGHFDAVANVL